MSQKKEWRCCRWMALGLVTAVMAGCAPLPENPATQDAAQQSRGTLSAAERAQLKSKPQASAPLRPDAYARSNYRDKGLGIKANKPGDADKADTPEDSNKYDLNPPRESDQSGLASWYGEQFHGRKTASGERFDSTDFTAAHRDLPFGSRVCVRSSVTGKSVVVRINDRGPFAPGRVIDLSKAAAQELGMLGLGIKPVELWQLDDDEDECPARLSASARKSSGRTMVGEARNKVKSAKHGGRQVHTSANQPSRHHK